VGAVDHEGHDRAVCGAVHSDDRLLDRVTARQAAVGLDREPDVDRKSRSSRRARDTDGLVDIGQRERRRLRAPGVGERPDLCGVVVHGLACIHDECRPVRVATRPDGRLDDDVSAIGRLEHFVTHGLDKLDGSAVYRREIVALVAE
jgi:hypothetical protein